MEEPPDAAGWDARLAAPAGGPSGRGGLDACAGLRGAGFFGRLAAAACRVQYWFPAARTEEGRPAALDRPARGQARDWSCPRPAAAAAAWPATLPGAAEPRLRRYGEDEGRRATATAAAAGMAMPARRVMLRWRGGRAESSGPA